MTLSCSQIWKSCYSADADLGGQWRGPRVCISDQLRMLVLFLWIAAWVVRFQSNLEEKLT